MTELIRRRGPLRNCGVAASVLATALTLGCGATTSGAPPTPQGSEAATNRALSPEEFAAVQARLENLVPSLRQEAGVHVGLELSALREATCLQPEYAPPETLTRWTGRLAGQPVDPAAANAALDAVRASLATDGWAVNPDEAVSDESIGTARELYFQKDGINITARYERAELVPDTLTFLAATDCTDHPEGHQMLRSPLDPEYGISSQYYPDGQ